MTSTQSTPKTTGVDAFIELYSDRSALHFVACGAPKAGTRNIRRRLFDHLGVTCSDAPPARHTHGMAIDVATRRFEVEGRSFALTDMPGDEAYLPNFVVAASNAEAALVAVAAKPGLEDQTRRQLHILALMDVRRLIVAITAPTAAALDEITFNTACQSVQNFATELKIHTVICVPVGLDDGANVTSPSPDTAWHSDATVLSTLLSLEAIAARPDQALRLPILNGGGKAPSGIVVQGGVSIGDEIVALPSSATACVTAITDNAGNISSAATGARVTLTLDRDIAFAPGDVITPAQERPTIADHFSAHLVWFGKDKMLVGRPYEMKIGARIETAQVTELKYRVNLESFEHQAAKSLGHNEVGHVNISVGRDIPFEALRDNRDMGGFLLIDKQTGTTVGAGAIDFALRRATNVHWQKLDINKAARAEQKKQNPCVLWFTGLSGSGKSTIANVVEKRLHALGHHTYLLDGDNVRHGLNKDLGFTSEDRVENIRRVSETAKLFADAGLIVITSFISPFRSERRMGRELLEDGEFIEVFMDIPLEECEKRDAKGLYQKARRGEIKNFTGIDSPYEEPEACEIRLTGVDRSAEDMAEEVIAELLRRKIIPT